jgi:hypothetical protein
LENNIVIIEATKDGEMGMKFKTYRCLSCASFRHYKNGILAGYSSITNHSRMTNSSMEKLLALNIIPDPALHRIPINLSIVSDHRRGIRN